MSRPTHGGNLVWAAQIADCPISEIIDFSASINPLGPPKTVVNAIGQSLDSLKAYPDPGYKQLRAVLAQWHQIPSEYILPGNGAAELLTWAAWELAQWESTYLITPAFADYWRSLSTFGVKTHRCPLKWQVSDQNWHLSLPASPSRSGLIWNNPHNPTGKLWQLEEILPRLHQFALVVVDEAFMDFLPPPQQSLIPWVQQYPNLVILRSLTKFYSIPGLRLGYAVTHPDRVRRWQQWRDPWAVNCFATPVAAAALGDYRFQQQTWAWLPAARKKLDRGLKSITGVEPWPSAANFLLVKAQSSSWLQKQLLQQHRILIRDCLSFPELGDRAFRIAVREDPDNQRLIAAIEQILG